MQALLLHLAFTGTLLVAFWTLVAVQWGTAKLNEAMTTARSSAPLRATRPAEAG